VDSPRFGGRIRQSAQRQIDNFIEQDEIYLGIRSRLEKQTDLPCSPEKFDALSKDLLVRFEKMSRSASAVSSKVHHVQRVLALSLYTHLTTEPSEDPVKLILLHEPVADHLEYSRDQLEDELGVNPLGRPRANPNEAHSPEALLSLADHYSTGSDNIDAHWIHSFKEVLTSLGEEAESYWLDMLGKTQAEHLVTTHQVVEQVKQFANRESLKDIDVVALPLKIDQLKELTGLTHIASARQHLIDQGYITADRMESLERESLLAARGVRIPSAIRAAQNSDYLVKVAVNNCPVPPEHPDFASTLQERLSYENLMVNNSEARGTIEQSLRRERFSDINTAPVRNRVAKLLKTIRDADNTISQKDAISIGILLESSGVHADIAIDLVNGQKLHEYERKEAVQFLKNLALLSIDGTKGIHVLFRNAHEADRLRFGYYAEAEMAVSLKQSGFTIRELSKSDNKSGHSEYDIIAETPDGQATFGIEVKTTIEAFFEKNWDAYQSRNGGVEHTQLCRLAKNAEIDGYTPAILARKQETDSAYTGAADLLGKVTSRGYKRPEFLRPNGEIIKWWE
jgi:hypothetical protein